MEKRLHILCHAHSIFARLIIPTYISFQWVYAIIAYMIITIKWQMRNEK